MIITVRLIIDSLTRHFDAIITKLSCNLYNNNILLLILLFISIGCIHYIQSMIYIVYIVIHIFILLTMYQKNKQ
jgi:hypothetical protein